MERDEAISKITKLIGKDLRELAEKYEITVFKDGKINKGWAGNVIERYLGLPLNSTQAPNFGSWELKTISLKYLKDNSLVIKETMAITKIDSYNIKRTEFEDSHLLSKLRKQVVVARIWNSKEEEFSELYNVAKFDIGNTDIFNKVKEDYNLVKKTIEEKGFDSLSGKQGRYIQPRTKGRGHGSKTRAFYARKAFLANTIFPNFKKQNQK